MRCCNPRGQTRAAYGRITVDHSGVNSSSRCGTLADQPRMNPVDVIADYQDLCGECPIWDPECGMLYWTDCVGRRFYRYDPESNSHEILKDGLEINGYRLNRSGGYIITNATGIWHWDGADGLTLIASEVD